MSTAREGKLRLPLETDHKAAAEYVMWPRDKLSPEEIDSTNSAIREIVGPEVALQQITGGLEGHKFLMFWLGTLNEGQIMEVERLDGIKQVQKDELDPDYEFTGSLVAGRSSR